MKNDPKLDVDRTATSAARVEIRPLRSHGEFHRCVEIQRATWGDDFEIVPATLLQVTQKVGGIAAGAFTDAGEMAGFVFGLAGFRDGQPIHWSHMLAVEETFRDRGIGRRLKDHQRGVARAQGAGMIYWTFDPLVARNAHLNLNRLGARIVEYVPDMYGTTGSTLHDGLGTDRFIAAWPVDPGPGPAPRPSSGAAAVRVEIPSDIQRVKQADPEMALGWREATREAFLRHLERGYAVVGFRREPGSGRCFYELTRGDAAAGARDT